MEENLTFTEHYGIAEKTEDLESDRRGNKLHLYYFYYQPYADVKIVIEVQY